MDPRAVGAALTLVGVVLAGCLTEDPPATTPTEPVPDPVPQGPGWVRLFENPDPGTTKTFGFALDLHEDDWGSFGGMPAITFLVAPWGRLDAWTLSLFEGTTARGTAADLDEQVSTLVVAEGEFPGAGRPRDVRFVAYDGTTIDHAVVAIAGEGGLAIRPYPDRASDRLSHSELVARYPSAEPQLRGAGTGMSFASHTDFTVFGAVHGWATQGEPEVTYGGTGAVGVEGPSPLLDITIRAPNQQAGHAEVAGSYFGTQAQGLWSIEMAGSDQAFEGLVFHNVALDVAAAVLGPSSPAYGFRGPTFSGHGLPDAPLQTTLDMTVLNADAMEILAFAQVAYGDTLETLLGLPDEPFVATVGDGLPDEARPPFAFDGSTLILDPLGTPFVLYDVVPSGGF